MGEPEITQLANIIRESLRKGESPKLTVTSNSMAPLLQEGDDILLTFTTASELQPGDIITIETETHFLTHRYWGNSDSSCLVTRGDRPDWFDPIWPAAHLLGKVNVRQRQNKQLNLQAGWGQWLNRHLAWLARAENRWFRFGDKKMAKHQSVSWSQRSIRRVIYMWATAVAAVISRTANKPYPAE